MLAAEVIIPKMFTAYAEDMGYLENGLHHFQYFCEQCDQIFASAWGHIPGSLRWCERGSYFTCPNCGAKHHKNVVYVKREETTPNKMRLAVKVYESVVTFEVFSKTVKFSGYLRLFEWNYKEIFRFDIAKQTVLFSIYDNGSKKETIELGNPFKLDVFDKSILRFFRPNSLANSEQKSGLNHILRVLRETIHRKLEKHLKHKVSSMFVSSGQNYGTFLLPIFNIAFRVACPDAPNLPTIYREEPREIQQFWSKKALKDFDFMDNVIDLTRRKKDFITALIACHSLPDKPFVRRLLIEDPFGGKMLAQAFALCQNYDCSIHLYRGLSKLKNRGMGDYEELFQFLQKMKPLYGETGLVRLVNEARELYTYDCINLYKQLNSENKKALKDEKVRLRDLHDWMSLRHQKQTHRNIKFSIPDHIIKRLSMQKDRLRFFLPKESFELLEAGHKLHNCVASYGTAMKDNQKWIVLVADDKGKLVACLEIKENELVQAKLDRNKPVSDNAELNNAILEWAKETNIEIKTPDIKVPSKKKPRIRIPA